MLRDVGLIEEVIVLIIGSNNRLQLIQVRDPAVARDSEVGVILW